MKKHYFLIICLIMALLLLTGSASAEPVCGEKNFCDSQIAIAGQAAPIPYSGDASWISYAPQLFGVEVRYSDGIDSVVDQQPVLIFVCSADGFTYDTCEKEQFTHPGSWPMRVTVAQNNTLFYFESYADTTLTITDQAAVDPDGISVTYHGDGAEIGSVPSDDSKYQFGDLLPILGNLGLDASGNPAPLEKTSFYLSGWTDDKEGRGKFYEFGQLIAATSDLDLYPVWEQDQALMADDLPDNLDAEPVPDSKDLPQPEVIVQSATVVPFEMMPFMPAENPRFDPSIPLETVVAESTPEPAEKKAQYGDDWFLVSAEPEVDEAVPAEATCEDACPLNGAMTAPAEPTALMNESLPMNSDAAEITDTEIPSLQPDAAEDIAGSEEVLANEPAGIDPMALAPVIPGEPGEEGEVEKSIPDETAELTAMLQPESNAEAQQSPKESGLMIPMTGFTLHQAPGVSNSFTMEYSSAGMELQLPLLNVTTQLVWVPLTNNNWEVKWLEERAGILEGSSLPGEGVSMIAAHNHLSNQRIGPFLFISNLKDNDRIFVRKATGELIEFVVRFNGLYKPDQFEAVSEKAAEFDKPIVLITCENESVDGSYLDRRVIFAEYQSM